MEHVAFPDDGVNQVAVSWRWEETGDAELHSRDLQVHTSP